MTTAYLAPEGFADQLQEELQRAGVAVVQRHERLFICDGQAIAAHANTQERASRKVERKMRKIVSSSSFLSFSMSAMS